MAIGGLSYVVSGFTVFLSPSLASRLPDFTVLGGIAELSLTLWLMCIGVNTSKWEQKSSGLSR
jgi:hypothetical protein